MVYTDQYDPGLIAKTAEGSSTPASINTSLPKR